MNNSRQNGAVALIATIITLLAILALSAGLFFALLTATKGVRQVEQSAQAYFAAESGLEDIVLRHVDTAKQLPLSGSSILAVNGAITTTTFSGTGDITITSDGDVSGNRRVSQVILVEDVDGVQFTYAIQAGNGGFFMQNTTQIIGTVYSNGPITGDNSPIITGDAYVAGTYGISDVNIGGDAHGYDISNTIVTGSAFATNQITNVVVGGNAYADTLLNGSVASDAYYFTSIAGTFVGGSTVSGSPPPSQVTPANYPISDQQLDDWQTQAQNGGTWSGACPFELSGSDTLSIGPMVIPCDVRLSNNAILTVTGTLWVQGNIRVQNSSTMELDSLYGSLDGVVIASNPSNPTGSGVIEINNSAVIRGSGDSDSYLMLVSRNTSASTGGNIEAVIVKNASTTAIFFAPEGEIALMNNVMMFEATGWRLHLKNTAVVEYQSGLADLKFSSGPTGGWTFRSWEEIE